MEYSFESDFFFDDEVATDWAQTSIRNVVYYQSFWLELYRVGTFQTSILNHL